MANKFWKLLTHKCYVTTNRIRPLILDLPDKGRLVSRSHRIFSDSWLNLCPRISSVLKSEDTLGTSLMMLWIDDKELGIHFSILKSKWEFNSQVLQYICGSLVLCMKRERRTKLINFRFEKPFFKCLKVCSGVCLQSPYSRGTIWPYEHDVLQQHLSMETEWTWTEALALFLSGVGKLFL